MKGENMPKGKPLSRIASIAMTLVLAVGLMPLPAQAVEVAEGSLQHGLATQDAQFSTMGAPGDWGIDLL